MLRQTATVVWAAQNGIVTGIKEDEFAPEENITREQIATILYRYAKAMGYDMAVGERSDIGSYSDFDKISDHAKAALKYAVASSLINGRTEKTINPSNLATRAEATAILQRFTENNQK